MFRKDLGVSDTKRSIAWFIKGVSVPEQMIQLETMTVCEVNKQWDEGKLHCVCQWMVFLAGTSLATQQRRQRRLFFTLFLGANSEMAPLNRALWDLPNKGHSPAFYKLLGCASLTAEGIYFYYLYWSINMICYRDVTCHRLPTRYLGSF